MSVSSLTIIQARMGSSRLPGKVLKEIGDLPMLAWVVERAQFAKYAGQVIVATTTDPSDDPLAEYCRKNSYVVFRGNTFDVLDRFYQAAIPYQPEIIIRLTADCPLIDPGIIDQVVEELLQNSADFAANRLPPPWHRTFPIGLDVEVCTFSALKQAWQKAQEPYEREHVMPYLYDGEGRFRVRVVNTQPDFGHLRWTVDTAEDLDMIRRLIPYLSSSRNFTWLDVLSVINEHPELQEINQRVTHKVMSDVDRRYPGGS